MIDPEGVLVTNFVAFVQKCPFLIQKDTKREISQNAASENWAKFVSCEFHDTLGSFGEEHELC